MQRDLLPKLYIGVAETAGGSLIPCASLLYLRLGMTHEARNC